MKRPSYSKRLQAALEGNFETEEEKEDAVDLLRAVVPMGGICFFVFSALCLLYLCTGISYWSGWGVLATFAFWALYGGRLAWKARTTLKQLESKQEPSRNGTTR